MSTATALNLSADLWLPKGKPAELSGAPAWLNELQDSALAKYRELGLPGIRDEQWRYTNLRALRNADLSFGRSAAGAPDLVRGQHPRLVFNDGFLNHQQSDLEGLPAELVCLNLATALNDHSDLLANALGSTMPKEQHGFQLLNTAYMADGFIILVADNAVIDRPIEIVFTHSSGIASHVRNVVVAGVNSRCTIIERHIGEPTGQQQAQYLSNTITEIISKDGAHIDHYKLHSESDQAFHLGGVFINQARDSNVTTHNVGLSGKLLRNDIVVNLAGQGSHVEMNGLVLGSGQQHMDNHTEVVHAVPHCSSDEFYKTILDDESRSVFRGRIIVAQDAQQTNADQQNNNLLLSGQAEADSKPQLEIYADDVKCSHGATVGQLDQKSLFYLQSRGINRESAKALLTFAFANEVIARIKVEDVRKELTQLIAGELVSDLEDVL